jgi:hypothetical protein
MDAEAALILGKSVIVVALVCAGLLVQLCSDKDPDTLYFLAFLAFLFFIQ